MAVTCAPADALRLLPAHATFDLWSIGAVLRALAHRPLLEADDRDNTRRSPMRELAYWDASDSTHCCARLPMQEDMAPATPSPLDLLSWLLQPDSTKRPESCNDVLAPVPSHQSQGRELVRGLGVSGGRTSLDLLQFRSWRMSNSPRRGSGDTTATLELQRDAINSTIRWASVARRV